MLIHPIGREVRRLCRIPPSREHLIQDARLLCHRIKEPEIHLNRATMMPDIAEKVSHIRGYADQLSLSDAFSEEFVIEDSVKDHCVAPLAVWLKLVFPTKSDG